MLTTRTSETVDIPLAVVVARLAARPEVDGLVAIGSTARAALTAASDYDLIVVLNAAPVALNVAVTVVAQRLTDIIFVRADELAALRGPAERGVAAQWGAAQLRRWLRAGEILFDRAGALQAAQANALATAEAAGSDAERYGAWFSVNYNRLQTRRMLGVDDPVYQTAVDLRLLFSLHDVWRYYFVARGLAVYGEKEQARHLAAHDPGFLSLFQQCLAETGRAAKFGLYEQLAAVAVAPLGGLWESDVTAVMPSAGAAWEADTAARALDFWQRLVGDA